MFDLLYTQNLLVLSMRDTNYYVKRVYSTDTASLNYSLAQMQLYEATCVTGAESLRALQPSRTRWYANYQHKYIRSREGFLINP